MLGKVKKWLGIEGVKLELEASDRFRLSTGTVSGVIRLRSMHAQTVTGIRIVLIERYTRGREEETLVDEYQLGTILLGESIEVPAGGEEVVVPFTLPFTPLHSAVDDFGQRNVLFKGIAWIARKTRNAVSEYRLEAEANVEGVALNPFDKVILG